MTKLVVEIYAKKDCSFCESAKEKNCDLCNEVKALVGRVNTDIPFQCKEVDISSNEDLFRRYKGDIPTIFINGKKAFKFKIDELEFRKRVRKEIIRAGLERLGKKRQYSS